MKKNILLLFSYGNLYILRKKKITRWLEIPPATSKEENEKRTLTVRVQEQSGRNYSVWIGTHSRVHQMLPGICQYRKSQIRTRILTSLPSQPIPLLHSISHTFFSHPILNVHPNLSSTYRFKTDGCNKLRGFGWKRKFSVTISTYTHNCNLLNFSTGFHLAENFHYTARWEQSPVLQYTKYNMPTKNLDWLEILAEECNTPKERGKKKDTRHAHFRSPTYEQSECSQNVQRLSVR